MTPSYVVHPTKSSLYSLYIVAYKSVELLGACVYEGVYVCARVRACEYMWIDSYTRVCVLRRTNYATMIRNRILHNRSSSRKAMRVTTPATSLT